MVGYLFNFFLKKKKGISNKNLIFLFGFLLKKKKKKLVSIIDAIFLYAPVDSHFV